MTGIKVALVTAIIGLVGVIESDSIDAWAKLTAIPILGLTIAALIYFNNKNHSQTLKAHEKACEGIRCSIDKIGEEAKGDRARHITLLTDALRKND